MKHAPRPVGSSPGYGWVVGYVFNVLNQRYGMNKDLAFSYCNGSPLAVEKRHSGRIRGVPTLNKSIQGDTHEQTSLRTIDDALIRHMRIRIG